MSFDAALMTAARHDESDAGSSQALSATPVVKSSDDESERYPRVGAVERERAADCRRWSRPRC